MRLQGLRGGGGVMGTKRELSNPSYTCSKLPPPVFLLHLSGLLPLLSVSIYRAVSPPREGVDDVIVSAGVSRVSVAIPTD